MKRRFLILTIVACIHSTFLHAQKDSTSKDWRLYPGKVNNDSINSEKGHVINPFDTVSGPGITEIVQDYRIKKLMQKHISINDSVGMINGFRVQLFSQSGVNSKTKAEDVQGEFLKRYPDVPAYLIFQSPNFKVRVGNFRTKLDALKFHKEVVQGFPTSYVVQDRIELPELE